MLHHNCFHTDDTGHDHVPFSSPGFPYACIRAELDRYPERRVSWHWHTSCEIITMQQGTVRLNTPDQSLLLQTGDFAFVNTGVLHAYETVGEAPAVQFAHLFHADFLSGAYNSIFEEKYFQPVCRCTALQALALRPDNRRHLGMISAMLDVQDLVEREEEGYEFRVRSLLCDFWLELFRETAELRAAAPVRNTADSDRMKRMMDFIEANYAEMLTVEQIGGAAGIGVRECNRCFRRCIRTSPIEYLTACRVRAAAKMLDDTAMSVLEVSEACGFSSPGYFSRVFKDSMGMTPKAWQKRGRSSE